MITLRTLADLKRATAAVGTPLHIENTKYPDLTRDTVITKAHGSQIITHATRSDGKYIEHCHLAYGKASDWRFNGTATAENLDHEGNVWLTVTVLDPADEVAA